MSERLSKCVYCGKPIICESENICKQCMYEYVDNWLSKMYKGR